LRQERVELDSLRAEFPVGLGAWDLLGVEDLHSPAAVEALGGRETDAAHADDAERPAREVLAEPTERFPCLPPPLLGVGGALHDAASGGEKERARGVGGGIGEHAGRVADTYPAGGAGGHVDVVEADGEVADDLEPGRRVEKRTVNAIGEE